jgi:hypothetical protein
MRKFTNMQKEHFRHLVLDCIVQRLTTQESLQYVNNKLGSEIGADHFNHVRAELKRDVKKTVFTTTPPFSLKSAEGQTGTDGCPVGYHGNVLGTCVPDVAQCPVGYHRSPSGTCEPDAIPPTGENRIEENTVCSGWSYTCG